MMGRQRAASGWPNEARFGFARVVRG